MSIWGGPVNVDQSPDPTEGPQILDTATLIAAGVIGSVIIGGFLLLTLTNHPTDSYVLFISGPVVTAFVGALLARRVQRVEAVSRVGLQALHQSGLSLAPVEAPPAPGPASPTSPTTVVAAPAAAAATA